MVRAILAGSKTQTRRVVKPQPDYIWRAINPKWPCNFFRYTDSSRNGTAEVGCPFGTPGTVLWVRETWKRIGDKYGYAESPETCQIEGSELLAYSNWRPSIHMPKWACRLWLRNKDVRIERLLDISDEDAIAEGYESAKAFLAGEWAQGVQAKHGNAWVWPVTFERCEKPEGFE
jgi:hypothetical protein